MHTLLMIMAVIAVTSASAVAQESKYYDVPQSDYPHDVGAGPSGDVWYSGQNVGIAGRLNPTTGEIERIALGKKSAPHGVSSARTAPPGSPTAARTPSCASIPPRRR